MPRGRHTAVRVDLPPEDREALRAWQRSTTCPAGLMRRARILLLMDAECGITIEAVSQTVGISRRFVYKWVERYQTQGLAGLLDLPRRPPAAPPWMSMGDG
jgi:Helix-turn-helix domain